MSPSLPRTLALLVAFHAPIVAMSCQEVPLFPLPGEGGGGGASATTSTTSATTSSGGGGMGGSASTTTTGSGGHGGMGGSGATTGSGGAGGTSGGAGGAGGTIGEDAGADAGGSGGAASGAGGAGGVMDDGGAADASLDDASLDDAMSDDAMSDALDDGSRLADAASDAEGACVSSLLAVPIEPAPHVPSCSPLSFTSNPPTSGPHYPVWAAFKTYDAPVPRGFYVHAMEHGAVVFAYNCPDGCAADIAALQTMLAARPADPFCVPPLTNRFIVTPDPLLDTRFAAAAWGFALKADCMDTAAMSAFIDAHYAKAPEDFCFDGTDVLAPGAGYPPDCGQPPISDAGTD